MGFRLGAFFRRPVEWRASHPPCLADEKTRGIIIYNNIYLMRAPEDACGCCLPSSLVGGPEESLLFAQKQHTHCVGHGTAATSFRASSCHVRDDEAQTR